MQTVTVVILNYNSREMLGRCIDSIASQTYPAVTLQVLDNNSTDDSVAYLDEYYPELPVKRFSQNLGFSRAHNWAITQSDSPFYMPLNPDLVLTPDYLAEMVKAAETSERVGAVCGKLLFMTSNGKPTDSIYSTGQLLTRSRSPTNRGYKKRDLGQYDIIEPVFAANGAAPLYRRSMLDDVVLDGEVLCEDYFMYGEDRDLGWRSQLRGWQCIYTPLAVGYHVGFGSGGIRRFDVQVEFTRNRYLTVVRNDRLVEFLIDLPYVLAYEVIWQLSRLWISPGRLPAHWFGLAKVLAALPRALRARTQIRLRRTVPPSHIRSFVVSQLW